VTYDDLNISVTVTISIMILNSYKV